MAVELMEPNGCRPLLSLSERSHFKQSSLMRFHGEMFPDCVSSPMNQIFFPSPFLKQRQMGSEVISGRCLRSLNCTLACLCIPRRDVAIIGPNGNRCRVRQDVASGARRAACQASGFAGDRSQCFILARITSGAGLQRRCQKSHPGRGGKAPHFHLHVKAQEGPLGAARTASRSRVPLKGRQGRETIFWREQKQSVQVLG